MKDILKDEIDIIQAMIDVREYNNAMAVSEVMIELLDKVTLLDFEEAFREVNSRIYLLAVPVEKFGPEFDSMLPGVDTKMEYALWVCMNGKQETDAKLDSIGSTSQDNIERLKKCGLLILKNNDAEI